MLSLDSTYKFFRAHLWKYSNQFTALCDQCSKYGYSNIRDFNNYLDRFGESHPQFLEKTIDIKLRLDNYHKFLRTDLNSHLTEDHSDHATHCLNYLFGCSKNEFGCHNEKESPCNGKEYKLTCSECNERFYIEKIINSMV